MEKLEFAAVHNYNLLEPDITVETILRNGNLRVAFDSKVDTGSTYCIFERKQAEVLEIDVESGDLMTLGTATGSFRAFGHTVELETLGIKFESTVYFAESEYFDRNVLGRFGWLNQIKLAIIDQEGKLFLSKNDYEN